MLSLLKSSKQESSSEEPKTSPKPSWLIKDLVLLSALGLAAFLFFILFSFSPEDPGFDKAVAVDSYKNYGGASGAFISSFLLFVFGIFGFAWPFGILLAAWLTLKINGKKDFDWTKTGISFAGLLMFVLAGSAMASLYMHPESWIIQLPESSGGVLGRLISGWLVQSIDLLATTLLLLVLLALGLSLLIQKSWLHIAEATGRQAFVLYHFLREKTDKHIVKSEKFKQALKKLDLRKDTKYFENTKNITPSVSSREDVNARLEEKRARLFAAFERKVTPEPVAEPAIAEKVETTPVIVPNDPPIVEAETPPFEVDEPVSTQPLQPAAQPDLVAEAPAPLMSANLTIEKPADNNPCYSYDQPPELPSLDLLDEPKVYEDSFSDEELRQISALLESKLLEFNVAVSVESVKPGPVVTRFEILPAPGVKVSQIANLDKDLARSLSCQSVRVVDVIPGKPYVGIEIPNEHRQLVGFKDILASDAFQKQESVLTMGIGKDIGGNPVAVNLQKMPHLLVAGTTGSGKSVGVNSMILSILFKARADEVRFVMIDPKMLELSIYADIPHLLTPVITDMSDAANALRWCVFEMDRRYELMSKLGVRNIQGFNEKVKDAIARGEPILDPMFQQKMTYANEVAEAAPTLEPLPYIVVVIDEFADMIMVVGKTVEELIVRLTQKARAAGIHLILATQRPSVNVITGLIKANVPSRISFQVSSKVDSRTILDQMGAEQLLGRGDMLYLPSGQPIPDRVHGAFVSDDEVHRVVNFIKAQGGPQYLDALTRDEGSVFAAGGSGNPTDAEQDVLYDEAVAFVLETGKVSISSIQRRFSIGYNRAARIVEAMEAAGLVSTAQAGGLRKILVPTDE